MSPCLRRDGQVPGSSVATGETEFSPAREVLALVFSVPAGSDARK